MKYICNDCGHIFEGSSYTTTCPECGSSNFIPYSRPDGWPKKVIKWVKENKLITAVIIVILLLILCKPPIPPVTPQTYTLDFKFNNDKNICTVFLVDSSKTTVEYDKDIYAFLELSATIEDDEGENTYKVQVKGNEIEICTDGELIINYKKLSKDSMQKLDGIFSGTKILTVKPKKNKGLCMPNILLGEVYYNSSNCQIVVPVVQGSASAYISINGKNGDYKQSSNFDKNLIGGPPYKNFDIWYYASGFKDAKMHYTFNRDKVIAELNNTPTRSTAISKDVFESEVYKMIKFAKDGNMAQADIIFNQISVYITDKQKVILNGRSISFWVLLSEKLGSKNNPQITNIESIGCNSETFSFTLVL